jgi:hypothetical protein
VPVLIVPVCLQMVFKHLQYESKGFEIDEAK